MEEQPVTRIVLVEDHQIVREGTRQLLEQVPDFHVVGEASDGLEAVELVERIRPDVVVMDIRLPRMNGIEATQAIKERFPEIEIIILSAYEDDCYIFPLLEKGASGYLLKTASGKELEHAIRTVCTSETALDPRIAHKVVTHLNRRQMYRSDEMQEGLTQREMDVMRYLYVIPGIILIGLALSVILLLGVLRRTISPLTALMEEAQRVADGGEFREAPVDGPPEISLLLTTFNRMMANQRSQREALRNYAKKILESQEEERKRISRDLHDETVQDLVGLSQRLELCRLAMVKDPQGARNRLDELQTLINRALIDVRRMSNDLRPSILEDLGLVAAARAMCQSLQQDLSTAEITFQVVGVSHRLPDELELATYRVIQEALSNIRRHARSATRVQVEIEFKKTASLPGSKIMGLVLRP